METIRRNQTTRRSRKVFELPMRDGNDPLRMCHFADENVFELPMRDGNGMSIFGIFMAFPVFELPMRDGNHLVRPIQ